jgi:hypothetical protein
VQGGRFVHHIGSYSQNEFISLCWPVLVESSGLRVFARHPLLELELLELLIILQVGVRVPVLQLATFGYVTSLLRSDLFSKPLRWPAKGPTMLDAPHGI